MLTCSFVTLHMLSCDPSLLSWPFTCSFVTLHCSYDPSHALLWPFTCSLVTLHCCRDPSHALLWPFTCSLVTLHCCCDPSHALLWPFTCCLVTLHMLSRNPPAVCGGLCDRCDGMAEKMKTGCSCCRTNFSEKKITAAVSQKVWPSFRLTCLCLFKTPPLTNFGNMYRWVWVRWGVRSHFSAKFSFSWGWIVVLTTFILGISVNMKKYIYLCFSL